MSAYEIEQRLSLPEPNLGIFQYQQAVRPAFPEDYWKLSEDHQNAISKENQAQATEYRRLDNYLKKLRGDHPEQPIVKYYDSEHLRGQVTSYLRSWIDRLLDTLSQPHEVPPPVRPIPRFAG